MIHTSVSLLNKQGIYKYFEDTGCNMVLDFQTKKGIVYINYDETGVKHVMLRVMLVLLLAYYVHICCVGKGVYYA